MVAKNTGLSAGQKCWTLIGQLACQSFLMLGKLSCKIESTLPDNDESDTNAQSESYL